MIKKDFFSKNVHSCRLSLFNDVYSDLRNADNDGEITGISINHIGSFLLIFADEMILFTKTPTELQTLLSKLQKYSTDSLSEDFVLTLRKQKSAFLKTEDHNKINFGLTMVSH